MMLEDGLQSFVLFAGSMFVVLNYPLRVIMRVRVSAGGPQVPYWLHHGFSWTSRLVGLAMLAAWAWVSTGSLESTLLIWAALVIGVFCLLDGPVWLATMGGVLRRGRYAPAWMERGVIWFFRLAGVGVLLGGLIIGLRATTG